MIKFSLQYLRTAIKWAVSLMFPPSPSRTMRRETPQRNRKQTRSAKRKRPLLRSVENDVSAEVNAAAPLDRPGTSAEEKEKYQYHSILRTTSPAAKLNLQTAVPPSKRHEMKISAVKKKAKKSKAAVSVECEQSEDSASDNSVSEEEENSAAEGGPDVFSRTWRGGEENCVEVLRDTVAGKEVAVFRIKKTGVALAGFGWMRVLRGAAGVLGSVLGPKSASVLIVSAPMAPFAVTVMPVSGLSETTTRSTTVDWLGKLCDSFLTDTAISGMKCLADECIILFAENCKPVRKIPDAQCDRAQIDCCDVPFSTQFYMRRAGLPTCNDGLPLVRGLSILRKNGKLPCFTLWKEWDTLAMKFSSFIDASTRFSDLRILVCGGSGTGKSMAVRCTINYLLAKHPEVVLIDTDVGQPEMNIPGLVAAHSVRRMRCGAPAASNRGPPIAGAFFGDITPRENPELYADCIRRVVARGLAYAREVVCPVIINSDGWISGTGAVLLDLISTCATPSHVITMQFADGVISADQENGLARIMRNVQIDRMFQLVSPLPTRSSFYSGASLRDLHIATYFGDELYHGRVRVISLNDVRIASVGERIPSHLQCAALNACVIAIACMPEGQKDNIAEWNVRGFGLVRGVDEAERNLYVATPVAEDALQKCDGIIASGGIQVPSSLFLAVAETAAPCVETPYVSSNVVATGGQMKSRSSLHRGRSLK